MRPRLRIRHLVRVLLLVCVTGLGVMAPGLTPAASAAGLTYYVSPTGNDSNPGASSARPFQHIQKCATVMQPGDTCLIASGDYRETVTPVRSGTAEHPIAYQPIPGATVTVDGTAPVSGWTQVTSIPSSVDGRADQFLSKSPFAAAVATGAVSKAHVVLHIKSSLPNASAPDPQVFYDNGTAGPQMQMQAQWPAPPASNDPLAPTVETAQDGSTNAVIVDQALAGACGNNPCPSGYWAGAKVYVLNSAGYSPQDVTATTYSGGRLGLSTRGTNACWSVSAGLSTRYSIYNKLENLAAPGQWFYDPSGSTLYFYSPTGQAPVPGSVTVKQRNLAFALTNSISYTHLTGLHIFGASIATGIMGSASGQFSTGDVLDSLGVNYPSNFTTFPAAGDPNGLPSACPTLADGGTTTGVILAGHGNTIQNSTVANSAGNGILLQSEPFADRCDIGRGCGRPDSVDSGNTATHNYIHDVDYSSAYEASGINLIGNNNTVTYNTIERTGRAGIQLSSDLAGYEMYNTRIAYNDISGYGMLNTDVGGIYAIQQIDFAPPSGSGTLSSGLTGTNGTLHPNGTRIDHNWLHDPLLLTDVVYHSAEGVFLDGGDDNAQVDNNVGWNNNNGTFAIHTDGNEQLAYGDLVYNNDGGSLQNAGDGSPVDVTTSTWNDGAGWVYIPNGCYAAATHDDCSQFVNNIGSVASPYGNLDPNIVFQSNLPSSCLDLITGCNPGYVDTRVADYQLQSASSARGVAQSVPGVTDGSTDSVPSEGAYQYGAARWVPGANAQSSEVLSRYGATAVNSADLFWVGASMALGLQDDPNVFKNTFLAPFGTAVSGQLTYGYPIPSSDPSNPAFANMSNLAIDSVQLRFFVRMYKHAVASDVQLSDAAGTLWAAPNTRSGTNNLEARGHPVSVDITSQVGGDWNSLPGWIKVYGSMGADHQLGGASASGVFITGIEIQVASHCVNSAAPPCGL